MEKWQGIFGEIPPGVQEFSSFHQPEPEPVHTKSTLSGASPQWVYPLHFTGNVLTVTHT